MGGQGGQPQPSDARRIVRDALSEMADGLTYDLWADLNAISPDGTVKTLLGRYGRDWEARTGIPFTPGPVIVIGDMDLQMLAKVTDITDGVVTLEIIR